MDIFRKEKSKEVLPSLVLSGLALVTAIVYPALFAGTDEFNLFALLLAIAVAAAGVSAFTPLRAFAAYLQFWFAVAACMFYIYGVYYYVSVVLVGIDLHSFSPQFVACTVLFLLDTAASVVNLFIVRNKEAR